LQSLAAACKRHTPAEKFFSKFPPCLHTQHDLRPGTEAWDGGVRLADGGRFLLGSVPAVRPGDRLLTEDGLYGVASVEDDPQVRTVARLVRLEVSYARQA
jgi:hypothetical protein